jgi:hypothetical protein
MAREYVTAMALRHTDKSLAQLRKLLEDTDADQHADAIEQRLTEWVDGKQDASGTPRAEKIAQVESVRAGGALAKAAYVAAGVTVLRWVSFGGSCPLCRSMSGRTVAVTGAFLGEGDTVEGEGIEPMQVNSTISHPPLHGGCDCAISAGER